MSYKNNSKKAVVEVVLIEAYEKIKSSQLLDRKTSLSELNQIDLVKANKAKGGSGWKINNDSAKIEIEYWENSWCLEIDLGFKADNGSSSSCITEKGKIEHGQTCGSGDCTFTATTSCTGGQVFDGVKCVCPAGQIFDGSNCITIPICIGGKILQGTTCVCPSGTHDTGSTCVTCKGGQTWDAGTKTCKCPTGQTLVGGTCQSCTGGKVLQGTTCVCPSGTHDTGSACITCKGGQVWNGSSCSCPSGQIWHFGFISCVAECPETIKQNCHLTRIGYGLRIGTCINETSGTCKYRCHKGAWSHVSNTCQ